jgi:hypothetical protein
MCHELGSSGRESTRRSYTHHDIRPGPYRPRRRRLGLVVDPGCPVSTEWTSTRTPNGTHALSEWGSNSEVGVSWIPPEQRPAEADAIEAEIAATVPAAEVRLTHAGAGWRVRALLPAAMCQRGSSFAERDVSARIAEIVEDAGLSVQR